MRKLRAACVALRVAFLDAARMPPADISHRMHQGNLEAVRILGAREPIQGGPLKSPEVAASERIARAHAARRSASSTE